jgi:hypothetical protein
MAPEAPDDEGGTLDLDLIAASLRADVGNLGAFVETLAVKLEEAIPSLVTVQRARRGMFGPKLVRKLAVSAGQERLELTRSETDEVQTLRARVSGGIVLKTEPLEIDSWLTALTGQLALEAGRSERTRLALERLLVS